MPDVVVMPSAYADGLAGVQRGFADLVALGVADRQPRLIAADPFSAYAGALAAGKPVEMAAAPTVSFSIGTPWATHQGLAALRASGGAAAGVSDDEETMRAQRRIAAVTGLYVEASSAICLPAVEHERGTAMTSKNVMHRTASRACTPDVHGSGAFIPIIASL